MNLDTICAIATANGMGAIGIIRISGNDALQIASKVFQGKNLVEVQSHTVHYGYIVAGKSQEPRAKSQEVIDEVMVSVFRAPKTFTAEDTVEISFHGSPHIANKILEV
jgi:tRNA modification GTPase